MRRQAGFIAVAAVAFAAALCGCTFTPDPCERAKHACLAVTVEGGPSDVHQLAVRVLDGYGSSTPYTPRTRSASALVYPLRFAIRFDEFDERYMGKVTFEIDAIRDDIAYPVAQLRHTVELGYDEHKPVTVSLGALFPPPDLLDTRPDLSSSPDLLPPSSPPDDMKAPADLAERPDLATP